MTLLILMLTTATAWAEVINVASTTDLGSKTAGADENTSGYYTLADGNTYKLTQDVNTGGTISGNYAEETAGGVAISSYNGNFTMTGGTITNSQQNAAGIAANQFGSVTIRNCRVSVTISSSKSGDGTHGGFVAVKGNSNSAHDTYTVSGITPYANGLTRTVGDGKKMNIGTSNSHIHGKCIGSNNYGLTIYGQSGQSGQLNVYGEYDGYTSEYAVVYVNEYVQHGSNVSINGNSGNGDLTVSGGSVTVSDNVQDDAVVSGGTVTIGGDIERVYFSGGNVTVGGDVIYRAELNWTSADDRFKAGSYNRYDLYDFTFTTDKPFHNGSEVLSGTITDMSKLDGKTLIGVDVLQDRAANDIAALATNLDGKQTNITLDGRTLYKDGDWNTLTLPFAVSDFTGTPLEGAVVKELDESTSNLDNGVLTLNFSDDLTAIEAGKPYIVKWSKPEGYDAAPSDYDLVNPVFTGVTIYNSNNDVAFTGGTFKGNYAPLEITDDNRNDILLLAGGNKLGYAKTDRTIENGKALGSFRAYFEIPSDGGSPAARSFVLNFGEETNSISEKGIVKSEKFATAPIYDLQGRKIANSQKPTAKGIYIVNGKKVIVK